MPRRVGSQALSSDAEPIIHVNFIQDGAEAATIEVASGEQLRAAMLENKVWA